MRFTTTVFIERISLNFSPRDVARVLL